MASGIYLTKSSAVLVEGSATILWGRRCHGFSPTACRGRCPLTAGQDEGALDFVFELADIAGPVVLRQGIHRLGGETRGLVVGTRAVTLEQVVGQQRYVAATVAQRRHGDREDVEAIVEILAEAAGAHFALEIAVGGGQHTRVDLARLGLADQGDLPLLQDAQQLDLHRLRGLADFIEEDGAAIG